MQEMPESTIQFSNSGKSTYFQNSFLWLIDYISFNFDTTYTYYISNNWKLSQDFAEVLQYVLRCLREELWAAEQFSFFPPDLMHKCSKNSPITSLSQYALQSNMVTLLCTTVALLSEDLYQGSSSESTVICVAVTTLTIENNLNFMFDVSIQ